LEKSSQRDSSNSWAEERRRREERTKPKGKEGCRVLLTNCFRASRRLVMNLRVRTVHALSVIFTPLQLTPATSAAAADLSNELQNEAQKTKDPDQREQRFF